ncbi:MAG: MFS transporter [Candidatus Rokubacteria bacterium]|nr:MFS transporter [Candidatus Rokubacteria bacterium]
MAPPPDSRSPDPGRWGLLALVSGAHALGAVSVLAVAPLAPLLLQDLHLSRAQVGLFLPAIYLGGVLMSLPAGWLTDRVGPRATLAAGQCLTGVMIALAAWAGSLPLMLALLFLAGLGWAVVNPATGRAILDRFPARERGLAMGVKQTGLTLGGVAGALTLPSLALVHGWRVALTVAAAASLVASATVLVWLRPGGAHRAAAREDRPRLAEVGPFLAHRPFLVLLGCGLALSVAQSSVLAYMALYARETLGMGVVAAGGLLALAQAGGTGGRLGWGIVSDRLFEGRRRPGIIINAGIGGTIYLVFASGLPLPGPAAAMLAVVAGIGAFGWVGLYFALAAEVGGSRFAGLLTGVAGACAWSGVLVGPPLFGLLLQATGSYRWPWLALALTVFGAGAVLSRIPPLVTRG